MHLSTTSRSFFLACLLVAQTHADSVDLTQFQEIAGFPSTCTSVYGSPIQGCTADDFQYGPCSQACVNGLQAITQQLSTACAGIATSPTTLIGLFLRNKGISTLCPKVAPSGAAATSTQTQSAAASSAAPSTSSSQDSTSTTSTTSSSSSSVSTFRTTTSTTDVSQTTSSSNSVQTSISINMTGSLAATATPGTGSFGGDIGIGGKSNAASISKSHLLTISLVVAGLTIGILA